MQCLTKLPAQRFNCLVKHVFNYKQSSNLFFAKTFSINQNFFCNLNTIPRSVVKRTHEEYRTIYSLFQRSNVGFKQKNNFSTSSDSSDPDKSNKDNEKNNKDKLATVLKISFWVLITWLGVSLLSLFTTQYRQNSALPSFISWNEFMYDMLAKGEVEEIIIKPNIDIATIILYEGAIIKNQKAGRRVYHMFLSDSETFEEKLRQAEESLGIRLEERVPVVFDRTTESSSRLIAAALVSVIILIFLSKAGKSVSFGGDLFSQMTKAKFTLVDPLTGKGKGVKFSDVAGLKEAKVEVMEFVDYLKHAEKFKSLGAKVPRGALLLGPPGCGKTLLAKAVATEANVPFLSMNGSEFIEMIGGLGAARVRSLFKEGRKRSPSIIYIDEIDAIGKKRSSSMASEGGSSGESEQTLNQLLVEMDGMASKEGIIVLASTNRAEVLDKALLRPGRFDRHILIDLPTLEERRQIFEQHMKCIVLEHKPRVYSNRLAYLTPGFSGADIANVCNEAALHAAREKKSKVDANDLSYAIDRMIGGPEKRDHAMSPTERHTVAYHEAGHALVGWLLEHTDALLKVTIVPRTNLMLGLTQVNPADQKLYTKEQLLDKMCMLLGGRASESVIFNSITTGAQNDLTKVTNLAYAQIQQYGMNENVGLISFQKEDTETSTKKPYSKKLARLMDLEAQKMVSEAYERTVELLKKNRDKLELLAEELLKKETLSNKDVEALIGPPPFGDKKYIDPEEIDQPQVSPVEEPPIQPNPV